MHPKKPNTIYCITRSCIIRSYIALSLSMILLVPGVCFSSISFKTAVVVSKKIKPYIQVADGIRTALAGKVAGVDVFFLSSQKNTDAPVNTEIFSQLREGQYDLVTAVGPEAAALVWSVDTPFKKLYAAILDPMALLQLPSTACGVSLRIPVDAQLERIAQTFPTLKRIGLIFDPRNNQWFFDQAVSIARDYGLEILALPVSSKHKIAGVLKEHSDMDAVWMIPDQTVISEKIIHYVIKQGLFNRMGVIGYNSFFTRSGAFFSFELEYDLLGEQAGEAINAYLETGVCGQNSPVFNTIVNQKIADKIGIRVIK